MKIRIIFTLLMLFIFANVNSQQVTIDEAQQRALSFINRGTQSNILKAPLRTGNQQLNLSYTSQKNGKVHYYVFNNSKGGYVIVGGDEVSKEIIGFSNKGTFDSKNLPQNLKKWLNEYDNEIDDAINNQTSLTKSTNTTSIPKTDYFKTDIEPLIKTTWKQTDPCNYYCPEIEGSKCVTGCIATAMAQVMNYYRWPEKGKGEKRYYDRFGCSQFQYSNFEEHTYQWDLLETKYNANTEYSVEQKQAIGQLMFDCGVSVEMQYQVDGSGALSEYIPSAMKNYFDYNSDMLYIEQKNYPNTWKEILYNELSAGRPIIYGGVNEDVTLGHQFICDGYDAESGFFHFNWGWDGVADGYFSLSSLKLEGYNVDLSYRQDAVIGIKPNYPPMFSVNTNVVDIGQVIFNTPQQATFTIIPNNLTNDITMSTTIGTLDITKIPAGTTDSINVHINFTPNHYGNYDGTITITDGLTTRYINVLCYSGHPITVNKTEHITVSPENTIAGKGKEVFIYVKTDDGYIIEDVNIVGQNTNTEYVYDDNTILYYDPYDVGQYQLRFYMPAEPVNISIKSKQAAIYNITWMANGSVFTQTTTTESYPFIVPTNRPSLPGFDFLGWTPTKTVNPDGSNIIYISTQLRPIGDTSCYAVFGKRITATTSVDNVKTGEYYLIETCGDKFYAINGADAGTLRAVDITNVVTVNDDNTITIDKTSNIMNDGMRYNITVKNGKASISNLAFNKYIGYNLESTNITNDSTCLWTIKANDDKRFSLFYEGRNILYSSELNGFQNLPCVWNSNEGYGSGYLYFVPSNKYSRYCTETSNDKYVITLYNRGEQYKVIPELTYGTTINDALKGIKNPELTGCEFVGWTTSTSDDNITILKGTEQITNDINLYAVYLYKNGNTKIYSKGKVYSLTISGDFGWNTFYAKEAVILPEGLIAYTAELTNSKCVLTELPSNIIPNNTAVFIYGAVGQYALIETKDTQFNGTNSLKGVTKKSSYINIVEDMRKNFVYVLKNSNSGAYLDRLSPMGTIAENQAYLLVPQSTFTYGKTLSMTIEEKPNSIESINNDNNKEEQQTLRIFNLNGRAIDNSKLSSLKGIYIINGKKVLLK